MKTTKIILSVMLFLLPLAGKEYNTRFYTTSDGLSGNEVRDIFQDSNGFLWFATGNGISRFDGQQFLNFQKREGIDKPLLSKILEDSSGVIWVSGRNGIYYLPADSSRFLAFPVPSGSIITGIGLLGGNEIVVSIRKKGFFRLSGKKLIPVFTSLVNPVSQGEYYIFTQNDDKTFFCANDKIYEYNGGNEVNFLAAVPIGRLNLVYKKDNVLYIATTVGAFAFNLETRQLRSLMPSTNSYNCLDILEDSFGYLWLATNRGLMFREPGKKDFENLKTNTVPFISTTWYWRVFEDRVNNLWFSPAGFGIGKLNYRFFVNYTIFSGMPSAVHWIIRADSRGGLWLAGPNGLDYYRNKSTFPKNGEKYLSGYDIRSLVILNDHQSYIAANNLGVYLFDMRFGSVEKIIFDKKRPDLIANELMLTKKKGYLLIATENGLYLKRGKQYSKIDIAGLKEPVNVWTMRESENGIIWLGTDRGLYAARSADFKDWKHWGLKEGLTYANVKSIEPVSEDEVWIAYFEAGGATKIDYNQKNAIRQLNKNNGLPNNKVFTIVQDHLKRVWFGTGNGLCRLHNLNIDIFDVNWGLLWIDFWRNAVYADEDSSIWFATSLGISRYIPKYEVYPDEKLKIRIVGAWYNEDEKRLITSVDEVPYGENFIRIQYAALNFKSEKEIDFYYRLEPVSPQWKPAPRGMIEFRSLAPGEYHFEVSSIESERRSSETPAALNFVIAPPFYFRTWFLLTLFLFVSLMIWWGVSLKTRKMRERNLLLNFEVKKRTKDLEDKNVQLQEVVSKLQRTQAQLVHSEKMASLGLLSAGLAHEVKNPISFTVTNAMYLKNELRELLNREGEKDEEEQARIEEMLGALDAICEGSKRVEQVVNNLQSFASPQEAEYKKTNLNQNLESTLKLIRARFAKRIKFEFDFDRDLPSIYCYPSLLNQVFLNMLINAIHAIHDKGKITISTRNRDDNYIEISFADTGEGIPEDIRERIFDPFFTTKPVGTGTGLGLAISHSIVSGKHKGKILLQSEVGKGTVFTILIPKDLPPKAES